MCSRFNASYEISESWRRLSEKTERNIQKHDILLLNHELYKISLLLNNSNMSQRNAHAIAEQKYNYALACNQFYGI